MSARSLAREWRADPSARPRIFDEITDAGMWDLFRFDGDQLLARITPVDRERITASGGGAHMPAHERRFREDVARNGAGMGFEVETHTGLIHMNEGLAA